MAATRSATRWRSSSWLGSTPRSRSRCAPTPRSAPSRSTCSATRSRRTSGCRGSARASALGAFGLTEPEAGSDAGNVRTRAELDGGEWVIDGAKQFITNAGTEISGVVCDHRPHRRPEEISNLIVANGTPGYEQGEPYRKMGWNASDTRPLTFDDCRVPADEPARPARRGLQAVPARARHRPHRRRRDGRRTGPGGARRGARLRQGAARLRPADLRSSSRSRRSSPTSRPRSRRRACSSTRPRIEKDAASRSR